MKFTPGPWHRAGTMVYALNDKGLNRFDARVQDAFCPQGELEANARLISKAPEMYGLLDRLTAGLLSYADICDIMVDAKKLLKEIDGETI